MRISIVTPSYKQPDWLRCALASSADQSRVEFEHLVQDACSGYDVVEVCKNFRNVRLEQASDEGMYDAINKGWGRASGDILCWLNCDEQYLPNALGKVVKAFEEHPEADIVFGDVLLVRPDGSLIAYRKSMPLRWTYVLAAHLYVPSCALFFRRRFFDEGLRFDTRWRAAGDAELVVRLLRAGYRAHHVRDYLACFTQTGQNLGATERAEKENQALLAEAPAWIRWGRPLWCGMRWLEKLFRGCYRQAGGISYSIFVGSNDQRQSVSVMRAGFKWRNG